MVDSVPQRTVDEKRKKAQAQTEHPNTDSKAFSKEIRALLTERLDDTGKRPYQLLRKSKTHKTRVRTLEDMDSMMKTNRLLTLIMETGAQEIFHGFKGFATSQGFTTAIKWLEKMSDKYGRDKGRKQTLIWYEVLRLFEDIARGNVKLSPNAAKTLKMRPKKREDMQSATDPLLLESESQAWTSRTADYVLNDWIREDFKSGVSEKTRQRIGNSPITIEESLGIYSILMKNWVEKYGGAATYSPSPISAANMRSVEDALVVGWTALRAYARYMYGKNLLNEQLDTEEFRKLLEKDSLREDYLKDSERWDSAYTLLLMAHQRTDGKIDIPPYPPGISQYRKNTVIAEERNSVGGKPQTETAKYQVETT
ncbi:MAG: hypothetical protein M1504_00215 [Candidatus Marsarchaeota archaeon]|nr:hypothetical protein [Candidatus Marsarchaeota archaeon]